MKKTILLLATSLMTLASCGSTTEKPGPEIPDDKTVELFLDNKWENGFNALPGNKSFSDGTYPENDWTDNSVLKYDENTPRPTWQVQQTGCIHDLNDRYNPITNEYATKEGDVYKFEGVSNYIYTNPSKGEITLGLNASKEYEAPRKDRENWPHLLLQNSLAEQLSLSELDNLMFSIDLRLEVENKMKSEEMNEGLHAAQFLLYFIVYSSATLDSGEFFYFGIPFYDNRNNGVVKENALIDNGTSGNTGNVIYQMSNSFIDETGFKPGKDYSIEIDLKEYFADALLACQKFDRFTSTTVDDLYISNMNIGRELPGTFDVSAKFSNFSLTAEKKGA